MAQLSQKWICKGSDGHGDDGSLPPLFATLFLPLWNACGYWGKEGESKKDVHDSNHAGQG